MPVARSCVPSLAGLGVHLDQATTAHLPGTHSLYGLVDLGKLESVGDQLVEPQLAESIELVITRYVQIRNGVAAMRAEDAASHVQWKGVDRQTVAGEGDTAKECNSSFLSRRLVGDFTNRVDAGGVDHGVKAQSSREFLERRSRIGLVDIDSVRGPKTARELELCIVAVECHDRISIYEIGTLHHIQPDPADADGRTAEEMARIPYEPLLPAEKKLIAGSLLLGLVLLGVLLWASAMYFPVPGP